MIEFADEIPQRRRWATRISYAAQCSSRNCDRTATHICVSITARGNRKKALCYRHTHEWATRFKAWLHELGCQWLYIGPTPRTVARRGGGK